MGKPATLTKLTPGARGATATAGTNPTTTNYAARGFVADYAAHLVDGTIITRQDRRVSLIGASIAGGAVPAVNDRVTIEGATYTIQKVGRDAASAMYVLQARGAG